MIRTLLFLCLVKHAPSLINTAFAVKWKDFDDVIMSNNVTDEISNIYSRTQCVLLCLQNEACVSVFYRRQHRRCQFHDVLFMSPEDGEEETGSEYYSLTAGACPFGYVHNRLLDFCYQLHPEKIIYDDGIADCNSRGEHLVVIDSEDKQIHIAKQITSSSGTRTVSYFFDGSDAANEGQWIFHDGRPMTYFAWGPGYPKNSSDENDYVAPNKNDKALLWHDRPKSERKYYVCEKDL